MFQTFEEFLKTSTIQIPIISFSVNLLSSAFLAIILSQIYIKFGTSLSNRKTFSKNFLPITMTTMLIITIVKSSLALSLGLVGALSIIRFRTAIKEPEELAYLFLTIAIGLGFGADQTVITIIAFIIISLIIIFVRKISHQDYKTQNLYLTINSNDAKNALKNLDDTLKMSFLDKKGLY